MKINKLILFFLSILCIFSNSILAWDDTHAKPQDFKAPDKHRIFIRGQLGYGSAKIPEIDETVGRNFYNTYINEGFLLSLPRSTPNQSNAGFGQVGLEYRFDDKFRLMYDSRTIQANTTSLTSANIVILSERIASTGITSFKHKGWEESTKKFGLGYFQPFGNHFSIGILGRKYDITQSYKRTDSVFITGDFFQLGAGNYNIESTMSGFVPGIGIEIKPTRWFEIHFTHENVNLKGKHTGTGLNFGVIGIRGVGSVAIISPDLISSNLTYNGTIQNLDFVFRYTSWFSTRYGFTQEKFTRKFENYYSANSDVTQAIINGFIYSALTESQVVYRNFHLTFEFSKGFN